MDKSNMEDNLDQIFDLDANSAPIINSIDSHRSGQVEVMGPCEPDDDRIETDYAYARENLKDTIKIAQNAIDDLSSLAAQTENPKAYEVLASLIKTVTDANKDLLDLQKKVKHLKDDSPKKQAHDGPVTNALFVGSTADLQKQLKDMFDK
tara:strand:- start:21 stop:470 length:450 start_codon:yes stop_codon:yes gene_type:complete